MSRVLTGLLTLLAVLAPIVAHAQGVLIVVNSDAMVRLPRPPIWWWPHPPYPPPYPPPVPPPPPPPPPASYKISELDINARLIDQVAQVQVSQTFQNTCSRPLEVSFLFPLPYDGAIDSLTLLVDGKEYAAKLLDKDEARRLYEQIVRRNRDPALLEWIGTGVFQTSVFPVPPGAKRTVSMRYSQLLRTSEGLTDFLFPLSTAKYTSEPLEKLHLRATIESRDPIKNVYSPTHPVEIKRPDDTHATVEWTGTKHVPTSDFRLLYDVGKGMVSTRVLSYRPDKGDDGFFLLLATPEIKPPGAERPKKTVVFVVDRSGSMSGKKIDQARAAARQVLDTLRDGDLFNIVAYDSQVESFRPELQRYNEETRKAAVGFIEGLYAGGSTNISGALATALGMLQDGDRPNYVLFLTDGLPTAGETNEMKIVELAKQANKVRARIFSFGVGYDVNSRLLDKLVRENFGQSQYVKPDEDLETHVGKLAGRIEAPVLVDVDIQFDVEGAKSEDGKPVNRVYPKGEFDLFAGEQLVVVGRYKRPGTAKVTVAGKVGSEPRKFDFPADLVEKSGDESNAFIEKLWALRRVGEILDELDLKGKNDELIKELVELAKRHGIMTPYTSFFADDSTNVHDLAAATRQARDRLNGLAAAEGQAGVAQRAMKGYFRRAEQFAQPGAAWAAPAMEAADALGALARGAGSGGAGAPGAVAEEAAKAGEELREAGQTIRQVGNRTFYQRDGRWIDSRVTQDQEQKARRVKQFSDEYFELARRHGKTLSQYLVFDEPVLLTLDETAYLIEP